MARASLVLLVTLCGSLFAQQAPLPLTDDEAIAAMKAILQHESRLDPMLQQLKPADWVSKGAADTYIQQFASANQQLHAIETDMTDLAQHPSQMSDCMRALFRAQGFHGMLESLLGGARRYQNPALADLIQAVAAEDHADLDRLQSWVLQLADEKEQQFTVVDHEAQRCRATLSAQPARKK